MEQLPDKIKGDNSVSPKTKNICCRVKNWSNCLPFLVLTTGPSFLFFVFCSSVFLKISLSLQKEEDFQKRDEQ